MKKLLSILLALTMCLSLMTFTAVAAEKIDAPLNPKAALDNDVPEAYIDYTDEIIISFNTPDTVRSMLENGEIYNITLQMDWSINSENDWKCTGTNDWKLSYKDDYGVEHYYGKEITNIIKDEIIEQVGVFRSNYSAPKQGGYENICYGITDSGEGFLNLTDNDIYLKLRYTVKFSDDTVAYSDWTEVFTVGDKVDNEIQASDWAKAELEKAEEMGLIPEILDGADLTADITRAEFAAVAVKAYEALANGAAIPAVNNPFTDTTDVEVLKAYNIGAVNGTSATTFDPNALLNREQAAAMLTRVFKKVSLAGWTLATDSQFTLPYEKPALFADDADISDWAKDSVYFMVANGIVSGVGNNIFAPKNVTTEEQAQGYANATREQALIIALRMVENLKK